MKSQPLCAECEQVQEASPPVARLAVSLVSLDLICHSGCKGHTPPGGGN